MDEINITETESRYYGDLFVCCDVEKNGKSVPILKATELLRSANVSNDILRQITLIAGVSTQSQTLSRIQFYSCLKLIAAYQANVTLKPEILTSTQTLPLPRFSWKTTSPNSSESNGDDTVIVSTSHHKQHHHHQQQQQLHHQQHHHHLHHHYQHQNIRHNIDDDDYDDDENGGDDDVSNISNRKKQMWSMKKRSSPIGSSPAAAAINTTSTLLARESQNNNFNSDIQSTDSEVEHNDSDNLNRTIRHNITKSPEAWSTASDSPTPTNSVAERRPWAQTNLWPGACEEQRQLLGTEEESSDRHSSDDDTDIYLEIVYQVTAEQREYYTNQFKNMQPDINGLLSGSVARVFFEKSRIPIDELRHIWQLCDVTRDGALSLPEFISAMHLIVCRKNNIALPQILPTSLLPSVIKDTLSQSKKLQQPVAPPEGDLLHLDDDDDILINNNNKNNGGDDDDDDDDDEDVEHDMNNENVDEIDKIGSFRDLSINKFSNSNSNTLVNNKTSSLSPIISCSSNVTLSTTTITTTTTTIASTSKQFINNNKINRSTSNTPPSIPPPLPHHHQHHHHHQQHHHHHHDNIIESPPLPILASSLTLGTSQLPKINKELSNTSSIATKLCTLLSQTTTTAAAITATTTITTTTTLSTSSSSSSSTTTIATNVISSSKEWLNQNKEWTKFSESPTSNVSSPGPKPVVFDIQRSTQAVGNDPQILHPVPLRVTPVNSNNGGLDTTLSSGMATASSSSSSSSAAAAAGAAVTSVLLPTTLTAEESSNESLNRSINIGGQIRKLDNIIYDGGLITIRADTTDSSPKHTSNNINNVSIIQQHRESIQHDLRAIQRPQAKKIIIKNAGAIPPPPLPQRDSSGTLICNEMNDMVDGNMISNKKDVYQQQQSFPPPPIPPPRPPNKHARSSSLDLNKLKLNSPKPPEIPPRISPPQIQQQISLDAQIETNTSFADFTQFPDTIQEYSTINQSENFQYIPTIPSNQRSSAFEVYRKPTPPLLLNLNLQHQPQQQQQQHINSISPENLTISRIAEYEKRVSMISENLRHITYKQEKEDIIQYLKEQNSLLIKICTDLSTELVTVKKKKEEIRLRIDNYNGGVADSSCNTKVTTITGGTTGDNQNTSLGNGDIASGNFTRLQSIV